MKRMMKDGTINTRRRALLFGSAALLASMHPLARASTVIGGLSEPGITPNPSLSPSNEQICRAPSPIDQASPHVSDEELISTLFPKDNDPEYQADLQKKISEFRKEYPYAQLEKAATIFLKGLEDQGAQYPYAQKAQDLTKSLIQLLADSDTELSTSLRSKYLRAQKGQNHKLVEFIQHQYFGRNNAEDFTVFTTLGIALRRYKTAKKPVNTDRLMAEIMGETYAKQDRTLTNFGIVMDVCERLKFPYATAEHLVNQESGFDNLACNKFTGALGIGQFINGTWLAMVHQLKEMTAGGEALSFLRDVGSSLTRYIGKKFTAHDPRAVPPNVKSVLAHRENVHDSMAFLTALVQDNRRIMSVHLGDDFSFEPHHDWCAHIVGAGRASLIIQEAAHHPHRSILTILKPLEIEQNPTVFGTRAKPFRFDQVMAALSKPLPVGPYLIAKERGIVELVDRRDKLLGEKQRPRPPGLAWRPALVTSEFG